MDMIQKFFIIQNHMKEEKSPRKSYKRSSQIIKNDIQFTQETEKIFLIFDEKDVFL